MNTFLITFAVFVCVIAAMAVGYIFQRKVVRGSCGGLGAVGIEKVCNCPEPCDARKRREAKAAKRAAMIAEWEKDRIA
ncbi:MULTISPECIES: (Na+)-NQR maturation NqrM [Vibrio]|uniref:(Na+)-NQR maturation NqrM n=2 Tax=Vibrio TaxID=662 RepID=A0A7X4LGZ5_9VIBR|nr:MULTISPECIES: (Na+)-NQR maturation NqrM [Vibrio]MBF8999354.1 (Na+)-NQR maturation NqrM [Vibrio nitrifigilis]MZI91697.1 (Na+)-NQR maturation NqrM [Vibrio eleionomae]